MVKAELVALHGDIGNGGEATILIEAPVIVQVSICGSAALLFHRWQTDSIEAKASAKKGSAAKKTDDIESYVWRNEDGIICLPGEYLRGTLINPQNGAAKYQQDPRSPRKSALDLFKAGIINLTELAPITKANGQLAYEWDFVDQRRVTIQRAGITRRRPGFLAGWTAEVLLMIQTPGLISTRLLHEVLVDAGRLVGVGDFRPTYGRYQIRGFQVVED